MTGRNESPDAKLRAIRALVDEQLKDDGLWFSPRLDYIQQELRKLHALVEEMTNGDMGL